MILTGIRFKVFITMMLALAVAGCSRDDVPDTPYPSTSTKTMKVAVVAPIGDAATKTRMERTAGWFAANFIEAQQGDSIQVRLEPEWYDELSTDLETLSKELAGREDVDVYTCRRRRNAAGNHCSGRGADGHGRNPDSPGRRGSGSQADAGNILLRNKKRISCLGVSGYTAGMPGLRARMPGV